ncbi:MAG: aminoacyl-tRNA deacylase [Pirellulaceae bacterium]
MNIEQFLQNHEVPFTVVSHPAAYDAQRLAQSLHVPGKEVAKTVLLRANGGYTYVVAVLPATKHIDLHQASEALGGSKLVLATELEIAEHCPDCEFGVLPPFGSAYGMKTIVDESITLDEEIYFEANTHHDAICMKFKDFQEIEQPLILTIAR